VVHFRDDGNSLIRRHVLFGEIRNFGAPHLELPPDFEEICSLYDF